MKKNSAGKCVMYNFCQLIYLNPMSPVAIASRMNRSINIDAAQKTVERFRKELEEAGIDVLMDMEMEQETGSHTWTVGYYIYDPFWRDKLELIWTKT